MSLGSRIASRSQAAIRATSTPASREPLLFLYPTWTRGYSTASFGTEFLRPQKPAIKSPQRTARLSTLLDSLAGSDTLQDTPRFVPSSADGSPNPPSSTGSPRQDDPLQEIQTGIKARENGRNTSRGKSRKKAEAVSVTPLERKVRKILSKAKLSERTETSEFSARTAYLAYKREEVRSWLPDWRVILADLAKHTPRHGKWLEKAIIVKSSEESASKLISELDDSIWDIGSRYDCSVRLGPRDTSTDGHRTFILSGSATSISKVTAGILQVAPDVRIEAVSKKLPEGKGAAGVSTTTAEKGISNSVMEGPIRTVVAERREQHNRPAHNITPPAKWNRYSFYDYVSRLTKSEVPNHLQRFYYTKEDDHTTAVVNNLAELFANPQLKPFISRAACNEAIAYFVKKNRIENARVLFVHMEILQIQTDPEIFNSLLLGAAKANDLHNFHFVLHLMFRKEVAPNAKTWLAFARTVKDFRIQLYILSTMKEKGLLQHLPALRSACELTAVPELESSLAQNMSLDGFMAHMDSRYGPSWLSVGTANHILHALGTRGLISHCWEFMRLMGSRECKPDQYSVNTILHHCKQGSNLKGAMEVMRALPLDSNFVPNEETFRIIFEMAWRSRSYNIARVVWKYACLSAATTFRMRNRVRESLVSTKPDDQSISPRNRFKALAGEVIIARQPVTEHSLPSTDDSTTATTEDSSEATPSDHTTHDTNDPDFDHVTNHRHQHIYDSASFPPKKDRSERANQLLDLELRAFQSWEPVNPFSDALVEALERDATWKKIESDEGRKNELAWMQQNAIALPVRSKMSAKGNVMTLQWV